MGHSSIGLPNVSLLAPRCSNDNLQRNRCKHKGRNSILGRPRCFHIADGSLRFPQGIGGDHNKTQHSVWTVDSDFRWEILMLILILDPNPRSCSFPRGLTVITIRPNIQYGFRFLNVYEWKIPMLILNLVPGSWSGSRSWSSTWSLILQIEGYCNSLNRVHCLVATSADKL